MSLRMQSLCVTIQMKATEKYFRALLFLTLYKLVATLKLQLFPILLSIFLRFWALFRLSFSRQTNNMQKTQLFIILRQSLGGGGGGKKQGLGPRNDVLTTCKAIR